MSEIPQLEINIPGMFRFAVESDVGVFQRSKVELKRREQAALISKIKKIIPRNFRDFDFILKLFLNELLFIK